MSGSRATGVIGMLAAAAVAGAFVQAPAVKSGLNRETFDATVRPQDDFYKYVNGTWLAKTELPADKASYGAFTQLADGAEKDVHALIVEKG